jgi:tetratricopeptide (TPR) repeat protein
MKSTLDKVAYTLALLIVLVFIVISGVVYLYYDPLVAYLGLATPVSTIVPDVKQENPTRTYAELFDGMLTASGKVDVDKQLKIAQDMVNVRPDSDQANLVLAQSLIKKGSFTFNESENADKALVILNKLLEKTPKDAELLSNIGYAYEIKQNYTKAFENYNKAILLQPTSGAYLAQRGHAYDLTGNINKAEADYLHAIKLEPNNGGVLMNLARLYSTKGDNAKVILYANKVIEVSDDNYIKSVAYVLLGMAAENVNDYEGALKQYSTAIRINPKYQNPYQNRAYLYITKAQTMKDDKSRDHFLGLASIDLQSALTIQKTSSVAMELYGYVLSVGGDQKQAVEYYRKALAMIKDDITLGTMEKVNLSNQIKKEISNIES